MLLKHILKKYLSIEMKKMKSKKLKLMIKKRKHWNIIVSLNKISN
jgi:hypothetical protein